MFQILINGKAYDMEFAENMTSADIIQMIYMELNEHIYPDSRIRDVMRHPAFDGKGRLLFPWDEPERYQDDMTMMDVPQMNLWHTNQDVNEMVGGINRMIDDRADGKQVLFDIYTEEELAADSSKRNTGLFFFRGKPGMPFAVVCAGGGSCTGGCGTWIWCRKRYTGRRLDFSGNRLLEKEHEIVK